MPKRTFNNNWRTPKHDLIHLWFNQPKNQEYLVQEFLKDIDIPNPYVKTDGMYDGKM